MDTLEAVVSIAAQTRSAPTPVVSKWGHELRFFTGVTEGTRTPDLRDHNAAL